MTKNTFWHREVMKPIMKNQKIIVIHDIEMLSISFTSDGIEPEFVNLKHYKEDGIDQAISNIVRWIDEGSM